MEKKETTETPGWIIILTICIGIVTLVALVTLWVKKSKSNYNDCIDNIPSAFWFEEELEKKFLTTNLDVVDIDDTGEGEIVVTIKVGIEDTEQYYRCLYILKSYDSFNWHWELVKYV